MFLADPTLSRPRDEADGLEGSIARATEALLKLQHPDGHWVFDLEADTAIPAEYVMILHFLGEPDRRVEQGTANYLRRRQEAHGGWPMLIGGALNMSASVKAYFALKLAGDSIDAPHMARARNAILAAGGAIKVNVFTRISLALYGIVPWEAVPMMPVEIMHAPSWFPFNLWRCSFWARDTLVPLMVLMSRRPRAANPRNVDIDELFVVPPQQIKRWPKTESQVGFWGAVFGALDKILRAVDPLFPGRSRASAIEKATRFARERLNGEDGFGAIFPSIVYTVMMFKVLGVPEDSDDMVQARAAFRKLVAWNGDECFCQPCLSPVWDTVLSAHALMEAAPARTRVETTRALEWLLPLQVLDFAGDWVVQRPDLRPGGWAFMYANPHYPDLDDTAAVVMALDKARRATGTKAYDNAIARAVEWVHGMQSRNGGWASYDADNTSYYLNAIPFADHGALLDPPTADVTSRCISMLSQLGERVGTSEPLRRGLAYLLAEQHPEGSWFGRWGVNYVYGTWSALCALGAVGLDRDHPAIRKAVAWLESVQNPDGGWGEDDTGYARVYDGLKLAPSTASQTSWALMGLMAVGRLDNAAVRRGIAFLEETQGADGFWPEDRHTATGFPRVFYLRYDGYPKFFPLQALSRYRNLKSGGALGLGM